ncbi:hypothetical protein GGR51DRAFT_560835 [Nemania sp. FL0031]|nr:hypothetical protein GGR51DRAFT_560835 [Nemania sp. FL0031]
MAGEKCPASSCASCKASDHLIICHLLLSLPTITIYGLALLARVHPSPVSASLVMANPNPPNGIIAIPDPPPFLNTCILLGVDPVSSTSSISLMRFLVSCEKPFVQSPEEGLSVVAGARGMSSSSKSSDSGSPLVF